MPEQISNLDLNRGWYMSTDKKSGTPNHWIMTTFRGMTTWGDCDKMKMANVDPIATRVGGASGYTKYTTYPPPTCTSPKWVSDFKEHHGGEFQGWVGGVGFNMGQYWEVNKGRILLIGGITIGVLVLVTGTIAVAASKKGKKTIKTIIKKKDEPVKYGADIETVSELKETRLADIDNVWKNLTFIDRKDILEDIGIDKNHAKKSWKKLMSTLSDDDKTKMRNALRDFWSWKFEAPKMPKISKADMKKLVESAKNIDAPPGWQDNWDSKVTPKILKGAEGAEWISQISSLGLTKLIKKKAMPNLENAEDAQIASISKMVGGVIGKIATVFGVLKSNKFNVKKTLSDIKKYDNKEMTKEELIQFKIHWNKLSIPKLVLSAAFIADDLIGAAASPTIVAVIVAILTDIVAVVMLMQTFDNAIEVKGEPGATEEERKKVVEETKKTTKQLAEIAEIAGSVSGRKAKAYSAPVNNNINLLLAGSFGVLTGANFAAAKRYPQNKLWALAGLASLLATGSWLYNYVSNKKKAGAFEKYSAGELAKHDFVMLADSLRDATKVKDKVEQSTSVADREQFAQIVQYGLRDWDFNCPSSDKYSARDTEDAAYKIGEARTIISLFLSEPRGVSKKAIRELAEEWLKSTAAITNLKKLGAKYSATPLDLYPGALVNITKGPRTDEQARIISLGDDMAKIQFESDGVVLEYPYDRIEWTKDTGIISGKDITEGNVPVGKTGVVSWSAGVGNAVEYITRDGGVPHMYFRTDKLKTKKDVIKAIEYVADQEKLKLPSEFSRMDIDPEYTTLVLNWTAPPFYDKNHTNRIITRLENPSFNGKKAADILRQINKRFSSTSL